MCKYWWIKTLNSLEKRTTLVTIENIQKLKNNLNPFKNIKKNIFTNGYVKFKKRYRNDAYKTLRAILLRITSYVYKVCVK